MSEAADETRKQLKAILAVQAFKAAATEFLEMRELSQKLEAARDLGNHDIGDALELAKGMATRLAEKLREATERALAVVDENMPEPT